MCLSQRSTFNFAVLFSPPLLVGFNNTCTYAFRWTCTSEMTPLVTKDLCLIGQKASGLSGELLSVL